MKCKICNKEIAKKLANHVRVVHNMEPKDYYDKYLKRDDENTICPVCGKPTKFIKFSIGYSKTCSKKCGDILGKQTALKKYGKKSLNNFKAQKKTLVEKYGENYFKDRIQKINFKELYEDGSIQRKINETRNKNISKFEQENNCTRIYTLVEKYGQGWYHANLNLRKLFHQNNTFVLNDDIPLIEEYVGLHKYQNASYAEKQVVEYIKSIYSGELIENTKSIITPYELDIYVPDRKIAIEFDGVFYHSINAGTDKNYHLMKTEMCENLGIRLIHIFEYEWVNRQDICKSIIASALGKYQRKIYARNCDVREVSSPMAKDFLEQNHIQGAVNSSYRLGLFDKDELVQLICIGKSRFKKDEYELLRMCTKLNTQVIGGFGKLMKHQPYDHIISYVDRSKFNGKSYRSIGFKIIDITPPSYHYVKGNKVLNRVSAQKHKLKSLLGDSFDANKTEIENMLDNNWKMIYDCGNLKVNYER